MAGVANHLRRGELSCEWFDELAGLAGQMDAEMLSDVELYILYSCGADTYRHQRGHKFQIRPHRQYSGRMEPRVYCPVCHKLTVKMFYKGKRWACQACQGLVERRTLLGERDRLILRRDALVKRVHAQPQRTRGAKTRERELLELMQIHEVHDAVYRDKARPQLPYPLRHALNARWFSEADERTGLEEAADSPAYLDLA